jgi:glutamate N-acetyltransferase/amino-acid N-acetyltransferase
MCALVEKHVGVPAADVIVASTGVIGEPLSLEPMEKAMPALVAALGNDSEGAASAIMTTDTIKKEAAVEFQLSGVSCRMGAIAKGSGMIHPNMATMLAFITTDAAISPEMLRKALSEDVMDSFNMISVDGDTSTNDMAAILANGLAGNPQIDSEGEDYKTFKSALSRITSALCRSIARDGEGATKLIRCTVNGAASKAAAVGIAKAIIRSPLVKCAMFGADANWGRVLCAIGYAGVQVDVDKVALSFSSPAGQVEVCRNGRGIPFSEEQTKKILSQDEVTIAVTLGDGKAGATAYGCDLSYDYVRINGDYRS